MGGPGTRSGRVIRPGLLGLGAAGIAVLAAACGSQSATTSGATQPASIAQPTASTSPAGSSALCADPAAVTRLVVRRITVLPRNHLHFAFPAGVTVPGPTRAQAVAKAVCTLPDMPVGSLNCPADLGVSYRLGFASATRRFPAVSAAAGGCGAVAGAGAVRSADRSPGFWTILAHTMGVSNAAALRGTTPAK